MDDLIIGKKSIMEELRLGDKATLFLLIKGFDCPVRFEPDFIHPTHPGPPGNWICNRQELNAWLNSRITAGKPDTVLLTINFIKEDLVVTRKAILDIFRMEYDQKVWQEIMRLKHEHGCPIGNIGGRWMTRLSLLNEWFNQQLRGEADYARNKSETV